MCHCIEEVEKRLVSEKQTWKGRVITSATFPKAYVFDENKFKYYIELTVTVEGLKKEQTCKIFLTHCPVCGLLIDQNY